MSTLMTLGQFVFSTDTMTFNELQRTRSWKHPSNSVAGGFEPSQFTGKGEETITLPCLIYELHGFGSRQAVDDLAEMADAGSGYVLIDGTGYIYGVFAITGIDDTPSVLFFNGAPRKIDCSIKLKRVDDDRVQSDRAPDGAV